MFREISLLVTLAKIFGYVNPLPKKGAQVSNCETIIFVRTFMKLNVKKILG